MTYITDRPPSPEQEQREIPQPAFERARTVADSVVNLMNHPRVVALTSERQRRAQHTDQDVVNRPEQHRAIDGDVAVHDGLETVRPPEILDTNTPFTTDNIADLSRYVDYLARQSDPTDSLINGVSSKEQGYGNAQKAA